MSTQTKQCYKCNSDMEIGHFLNHGLNWINKNPINSFQSKFFAMINLKKTPIVIAWKCKKCNSIELESSY